MLTIFLICSYLGVSFTSPKPVIFGKSTTGQGEDYTTEFLLDYEYIKNHYRLMTIDLSRRKELDADPEAIHQTEFAWQLKKLHHDYNATDAGNDQSVCFNNFKNQRNETKIFSKKCNSIIDNDKLLGKESYTDIYTIKQIKICSRKRQIILRIRKTFKVRNYIMNYF